MKKLFGLFLFGLFFNLRAEPVLNFSVSSVTGASGNGFTSVGSNSTFTGTRLIDINSFTGQQSYNFITDPGAYAAVIQASTSANVDSLASYLGIQSSLISNYLDPAPSTLAGFTPTNFA
jgi:hypothetical protein